MYRLNQRPHIRAMDYATLPTQLFLNALPANEKPDCLGTGAAVFRTVDQVPYLLIIRRSQSDSLPGLWEIPGGGVDPEDRSLKDAVTRELKEETGLTAAWMVQEVGYGQRFNIGRNRSKNCLKLTFIVEVDEIGILEHPSTTGGNEAAKETTASNATSDKEVPAFDRAGDVSIKLNDREHDRHLWVTRSEVERLKVGDERVQFVSEDQKTVLLMAFDIQDHVIAAKASE